MTAYYAEPLAELHQGDCRAVMARMPAESVDCVIFSPPFFGLRKYDGVQVVSWADGQNCPWGLEPSVELWVAHTLEVMQAVKRVLKPSGVCWVEVSDSYNSQGGHTTLGGITSCRNGRSNLAAQAEVKGANSPGLKPKDLCLVPERLALALQQDGWWVRSRIVWAKPNPMPESVTDRPTKSHSTIWMLTKAADYYFDPEAVRETLSTPLHKPGNKASFGEIKRNDFGTKAMDREWGNPSGRNLRDVWTLPTSPFGYELCQSCGQIYTAAQFGRLPECIGGHRCQCQGQDGLTDWQEAVIEDSHDGLGAMMQPAWLCPDCETIYSLAEWNSLPQGRERLCRCGASDFLSHFAVFPEALPSRCILASTSEAGCCPKCGKPWTRILKKGLTAHDGETASAQPDGSTAKRLALLRQSARERGGEYQNETQTLGWAPGCKCGLSQAENVPATVLDVCSGSGTTVLAAKKLGRRAVGIDLSEKYLALSQRRLSGVPLSLVKGG